MASIAPIPRLRENRLVADGVDANLVAGGVESEMLQGEIRGHPHRAAEAGDAEALAAQILGFLDFRPDY